MGVEHASAFDLPGLEDSDAVDSTTRPRRVQERKDTFDVNLPKVYARMLGINKKSTPVDVRYIKGLEPVVVDEPCIVIRPHPEAGGGAGE